MLLAPSILASDFTDLKSEIKKIEEGGADLIHMDIMDGHFVPNISYGPDIVRQISEITDMPFDVHLMIENPERYIEKFITKNTEYICVHEEASVHLNRLIDQIKSAGARAGVAINPSTPVVMLDEVLRDVDMVLVMAVNPGFGGQKFLDLSYNKIKTLDEKRKHMDLGFKIAVDGGVTLDNAEKLAASGSDIFVMGTYIFKADDVRAHTEHVKKQLVKYKQC